MGTETVLLSAIIRELSAYYNDAPKCEQIIMQHSLVAGAAALIPFPTASLIVTVISTYSMLVRIFTVLKIKIGENIVKTLISYCTTCLIGNLSAVIIAFLAPIAADLIKFIPGFGTVAGLIAGPVSNAVIVYVYGWIFLKSLLELCKSGKEFSESSFKENIKDTAKRTSNIKKSIEEAKEKFKDSDFSQYKKEAEEVFNQNKDKCLHCGAELHGETEKCPNCGEKIIRNN